MADSLIQLPNKDLWRGHVKSPKPSLDTEVIAAEAQDPLNRAMAAVLAASKGAQTLSCLWCGLQGDEKYMRAHLQQNHPSVTKPAQAAEIALAQVAMLNKAQVEQTEATTEATE